MAIEAVHVAGSFYWRDLYDRAYATFELCMVPISIGEEVQFLTRRELQNGNIISQYHKFTLGTYEDELSSGRLIFECSDGSGQANILLDTDVMKDVLFLESREVKNDLFVRDA